MTKIAVEKLKKMGSKHLNCSTEEIVFDEENKIISTPAYMTGQRISEVAAGIEKTVKKTSRFNLVKRWL